MPNQTDSSRCPECNSVERVQGSTHYECSNCRILLEPLEPDPGFVPQPLAPRSLSPSDNSLGSVISKSKDPKSESLRRSHQRATSDNSLFIDKAIEELVGVYGFNRISADAADLLFRVNRMVRLGGIRKKRRGAKGMGEHEARTYRTRVFASAALHIRRNQGQSNTSHQVSTQWGINHHDLVDAIRFLNSHHRPTLPEGRGDPTAERIKLLNREADVLTSFLHEQFRMPTVIRISETQIGILRDHGEPFYLGDEWLNGRFTNTPAPKATFIATVEAMAKLGLTVNSARELFDRRPIRGLKSFVERCAHLFENSE